MGKNIVKYFNLLAPLLQTLAVLLDVLNGGRCRSGCLLIMVSEIHARVDHVIRADGYSSSSQGLMRQVAENNIFLDLLCLR